ncbi:ADAM family mig-17 [Biomphalaria glabrata]|nr:ADAM family mig-17 [Biomphalaria glabrata]
MSVSAVLFLVFIGQISSTDVMLQYESSDVTGDQMPDQVNVTFNTETKSLTKLNLRRSRYFNLDIPVYTLDTDREGFFQKHKVKTRPRKDIGFYQDYKNNAVFRIQRSPEKLAYKKSKLKMKGEFLMNTSKYLFDSDRKSRKRPWRKPTFQTFSDSRKTAIPPPTTTIFDQFVYALELVNTTRSEMFDKSHALTAPSEVKKLVRMKVVNIRDKKLNSAGQNSNRSISRSVPQNRPRRRAGRDYYVDVVALADFKMYSRFLAHANNDHLTAMQNILENYAYIFSGADMLYQAIQHPEYTIHILLSKLYVLQTLAASRFTGVNDTYGYLNEITALNSLTAFYNGYGRGIVGIYDHVMLFTGYDLCDQGAPVSGSTFNATMCQTDGKSVSVIWDRQGYNYDTIDTVAHELAHSLSAFHDGEVYPCNDSQRYIMDISGAKLRPGTEFNPWRFSPCSIRHFTSFLEEKMDTSRGYRCLVYSIETSADIPDVNAKQWGQLVKPDQQCQQMYGSGSYVCRLDKNYISTICRIMYCFDPLKNACYQISALIGTSCGDGKICIHGQCVSDPYAPQVNENCVLGDKPGDSCSSFVKGFNGVCYDSGNYIACCASCNEVSRPVLGCEYGDRIKGCTIVHCYGFKVDCCGTCKYGTPYNPTTSIRRTTPKRLATTVKRPVIFTLVKVCKPGDKDLRPELCTGITVCLIQPSICCSFCFKTTTTAATSKTTTKECKPGDADLYPELCTSSFFCLIQPLLCCHSCSYYFQSTTTTTPTTPFITTTSPKECKPGDPDVRPELCSSPRVCLIRPLYCCNYCSYYFQSTPRTTRTTRTTPFIISTLPKECKPGVPDVRPELCSSPRVCLIQPLYCCNYCSYYFQSTPRTTPTTPFITPTLPKGCEPGDLDLRPQLCTNISICKTQPTQCCNYCSIHFNTQTTSTTQLTSPKECVLGEPDLSPELCTRPSTNHNTIIPLGKYSLVVQIESNIP